MVHYVPASLENLTEAIAFVMDNRNENQMRSIVESANSWCKSALTVTAMATDALMQLEIYRKALYAFDTNWQDEWLRLRERFHAVGDLADCDVLTAKGGRLSTPF